MEKYLNACLLERIQSESRFKQLKVLGVNLQKRFEQEFRVEFQRNMFDNTAQINTKYYEEFWRFIEKSFDLVLVEEIEKIFKSRKTNRQPEFLVSYFRSKVQTVC